jgi:Kef-type K+ transport system membrane component KefB
MQLAAILIAARLFAEIAAAMNIPRVIGELMAGIVLGPSLLGWITPNEPIKLLAEIGIILLLFEVGLHTDLNRLVRARGGALRLALVGFVAPFIFGWVLSRYFFGLSNLVSLFIGGTLTATSIGVTIRILADLGRDNHSEGQVVLGAAVIDDLLGVALLAVLHEFATTGTVTLAQAGKITIYVGAFFLLAPIAAKLLSVAIRHVHGLSEAPGLIPASLVAMVLSFAALAHVMGAPELLGGFAAGIALSRRFFLPLGLTFRVDPKFNRQIHEQMKPIIQLFTPIFFVMVGLSLDLSAVDWGSGFIWMFSLSLVFVAILGKLLGGVLVQGNPWARVAMGMSMVPRGEVGLIFAELGRISGIFDDEVYAGIVIVIAYTTVLSPFWIKLYYRHFGWRFTQTFKQRPTARDAPGGKHPGD